eukprot:scaffold13315_cov115-Isochrysis_galbana.AAC.2
MRWSAFGGATGSPAVHFRRKGPGRMPNAARCNPRWCAHVCPWIEVDGVKCAPGIICIGMGEWDPMSGEST